MHADNDPERTDLYRKAQPTDGGDDALDFGIMPKPRLDRCGLARAALGRIMNEVEQFYALVLPVLERTTAEESTPAVNQFFRLHEALGRLRAVLPRD